MHAYSSGFRKAAWECRRLGTCGTHRSVDRIPFLGTHVWCDLGVKRSEQAKKTFVLRESLTIW